MAIRLTQLPYQTGDLEPFMSKQTVEFHYEKHHKNYVEKTNQLIRGTAFDKMTLKEIILSSAGKDIPIYNNAAQVWNHDFFWQCLTPSDDQMPSSFLSSEIERYFGSFEAFETEFNDQGAELFGSGWVWLVRKSNGSLEITSTSNAENPMVEGHTPLLICDVWEHAYYIDCRNDRKLYLENFWNIVDWEFVEANLEATEFSRGVRALDGKSSSRATFQ